MRSPKNPSPTIIRWALCATLLVALALVASITAFKRFQPHRAAVDADDTHTYRTVIGAFRRIPLDDGTMIELNTNTAVHVELTKTRREITLLQGEAHFDVERAATRPFIVRAGHTVVRALGTGFAVRVYDESRAAVLVTKGRVAVSTASPSHALLWAARASATNESLVSAGEHAIDNAGHLTIYTLEHDDMMTRQAWRHGSILFRDRPLSEVVSELNRYNEKQMKIVDPSIADVRFSGQLALRGTDRFLAVLAKAHGILAREAAGHEEIVELRRGNEAP